MSHSSITDFMGKRARGKAGNNTYVYRDGEDTFSVFYHGSKIAEINPNYVAVSLAGYGTVTTRDRVNQILSVAGIPFYVAQRAGVQTLFQRIDGKHEMKAQDFDGALFAKIGDDWAPEMITAGITF